MQVTDLSSIDPNVDYSQILPIQQKRTIAFINHFVTNTVSFLNHFAQSCESRLMEFEYKLQKVEASLLILESQLGSIPHLEEEKVTETKQIAEDVTNINLPVVTDEEQDAAEPSQQENIVDEDPRYEKYVKMLKYGTPEGAVKLKMQSDGIDPSVLHTHPQLRKYLRT